MNCIVISLGGLRVHYLGCYGGTWLETPAFDRFAAEGFVFDECFVVSPSPAATRNDWWTGCYQNFRKPEDERATPDAGSTGLIRALRSAGIRTVLIRDFHERIGSPRGDAGDFSQVIEIDRPAEDSTSSVFEAARQWMQREASKGQFLLFIDCHGAHPPWYPPKVPDDSDVELKAIEAEQEPEEDIDNNNEVFDTSGVQESSELVGANQTKQVYAAVVAHLDAELGAFLDFLRGRAEWDQALVAITSDCGTCLEDDQSATLNRGLLHESRTHVPLLIRMPTAHDPASRSAALVQSIDLIPTVCEAIGVAISPDVSGRSLLPILRQQVRSVRDYALMADPESGWSIRTSAWHLILPRSAAAPEAPPEPQLFIKPDDRWDRNDVAKQYPDVVEQLVRRVRDHSGSR